MIVDHYHIVRLRSLDFKPLNMKVNNTLVWIKISFLELEYYDESVLVALASAEQRPVRIDISTMDAS